MADGAFSEQPETHVYVDVPVFYGADVLLVSHDEDGDWQFLSGAVEEDAAENARHVHLHHIVDRDPTLRQLADLPTGWWAERERIGAAWTRGEWEPEE